MNQFECETLIIHSQDIGKQLFSSNEQERLKTPCSQTSSFKYKNCSRGDQEVSREQNKKSSKNFAIWIISKVPKRFYITFLVFIGLFLISVQRANVGIVIAEITSPKTIVVDNNQTFIKNAEFKWTSLETGLVIGGFSVGYMFAFSAGLVIHKIGGVTICGFGIFISGIVVLLTPILADTNLYSLILGRVILGFFEGISRISFVDVFAHWSPKSEQVRLVSISNIGVPIGEAINYPLCGIIVATVGWRAVFYITGTLCLIWSCTWLYFVSNDPSTDKFITQAEKSYLAEKTVVSNQKVAIPFREIFTSVPVYALINELFVAIHIKNFIGSFLPLYVKDVLLVNIETVGFISGIPTICSILFIPVASYLADYLRSHNVTIGKVHRIYMFWGQVGTLTFFFIAAMFGNLTACIICFSLLKISFTFPETSYGVIFVDMAGPYCGFLKSLCASVMGLGSFTNSIIIGLLVPNHSQLEWNIYFFFLCFFTMYGVIVFLIFGSGELQSWAGKTNDQFENTNKQHQTSQN